MGGAFGESFGLAFHLNGLFLEMGVQDGDVAGLDGFDGEADAFFNVGIVFGDKGIEGRGVELGGREVFPIGL